MNRRFEAKHGSTGEWAVWDNKLNREVASGLNLEEAESGAENRNKAEETERERYI